MVILLTGSTGFIGRHLARALREAGHHVVGVSRTGAGPGHLRGDFTRDLRPDVWLPRLQGVDVVVNAVGILRESGSQTFQAVHTQAPQALFRACAQARIRHVIQISALGAQSGSSGYFRSKHATDQYLASLPVGWTIVQPALVYGRGGVSARLFTTLASLPVIFVPGRGDQRIQPIHIDDLVSAVVALCDQPPARRSIALVGPYPLSYREWLLELRKGMGLGHAPVVCVPLPLMRLGAWFAQWSRRSLLDRETLDMLAAGNVADPADTARLLGRAPREVAAFVAPGHRREVAVAARLQWLLPLLRIAVAWVWIWTGIVSLGLYPREHSLALLYRTGVPANLAPLMLYGAAILDLALGVATLAARRRRALWLVQIALILAYTVIITLWLPEFWLHPYGPLSKNLPLLAALYMLYALEDRTWNTSS